MSEESFSKESCDNSQAAHLQALCTVSTKPKVMAVQLESKESDENTNQNKNNLIKNIIHNDENTIPYSYSFVPLCQSSISLKQESKKDQHNPYWIFGGFKKGENDLHSLQLIENENKNQKTIKLKKNQKKNANLKKSNVDDDNPAPFSQSFLTSDQKYIIVIFSDNQGYNVYDVINDEWVLNTPNKQLSYDLGFRGLLFNDS